MSAPYALSFDRRTRPGRVLLRAASSINNHGLGALELHGRRTGARTMALRQAIHHPDGTVASYRATGRLGFKYVPGARFGSPSARPESYWKFRGAARFELWSVDRRFRATRLVRTGPKLFYCFRDLFRTRRSGRSPEHFVYPACNQNRRQLRVVLGTSVGWSDVYPASYPEQWIDVTGLRGRFAYVQTADPGGRIYESNDGNNLSETYVQLPSGRVLGQRVALAAP